MKTIDDTTFAVAEFTCLRDEILKRIEFQNQIVNLTLVIAGSVVSFAFGLTNGAIILPIYPLISFGLAASWEQHNRRIRQLGVYIRENLETRTSTGWEKYRVASKLERTRTASYARVTFIFTQVGIILISILLSNYPPPPIWIILFVIDVIAVIATGLVIQTLPLEPEQVATQPGDASDAP